MVLENSSDPSGGDTFEPPPPSDNDPYSSSSPQATASMYRVDRSGLPKPIPIIGGLTGFNDQFFLKVLQARIDAKSKFLKRQPTQEEVEATSFWVAKQLSIYSYATPVGILCGAWRAFQTAATYRFPFWQPNLEVFNPHTFPSARMPLVRGSNALLLWQGLRYASYGMIGKAFSQILFGSYSMTVATVGEMGDPRLKAVVEAAAQQDKQRRRGLQGPAMPGTAGSPQNRAGSGRPVDDASPTGGMFPEETSAWGDNSTSQNDDLHTERQPQSTRWPQKPRQTPVPVQHTERDEPFDPFDDAYASGSEDARADVSASQPQRQQGSAWDRVRQTAGRGSDGRQSDSWQHQEQQRGWTGVREQARSPPAGGDYAFSGNGDEERGLAKSEAQKEFDARVERERRGGDFTGGSGDQKRW